MSHPTRAPGRLQTRARWFYLMGVLLTAIIMGLILAAPLSHAVPAVAAAEIASMEEVGPTTDIPQPGASTSPLELAAPPAPASMAPAVACSVPVTAIIRGKEVKFDQCYDRAFTHDSVTYDVHVFYTEDPNIPENLSKCDADETAANRCEHALPDTDDGNGDNIYAVQVADEGERAIRFYSDRNMELLGAGNTVLKMYLAEDPSNGFIIIPDGFWLDDDFIANNDLLRKRWNTFHEMQHMVQEKYNDNVGWQFWYTEGLARAIEDRVDPDLDNATNQAFATDTDRLLSNVTEDLDEDGNQDDNEFVRHRDILEWKYRAALWWAWVMDQYREPSETEPVTGWLTLLDFYEKLVNENGHSLDTTYDLISERGSTFPKDFVDFTLAMYAMRFNPSDPRLTFLDDELKTSGAGFRGHTVISAAQPFATVNRTMAPRSTRHWEFNPANVCDYVAFTFDGNGKTYAFSLLTVESGTLKDRWTSWSSAWARTVRSIDLERVAGVVTAVDSSGAVEIGYGCVTPTVTIKRPTTNAFAMVGEATNPRQFIVRLRVAGQDQSAVAGLVADDFEVEITKLGGGSPISATVINAAYVQDDYWLLVQAPNDVAGAETGSFYDLSVTLGSSTDSESGAIVYLERTQDKVIVLDRSGSMGGTTGRIEAARNAATLMTDELSENDQGGYVAFDTDAILRRSLAPMTAVQRTGMVNAIAAETPGNATSIGDGMLLAAQQHDANGIDDNLCSFVLLSDGYENEPQLWDDIKNQVIDNGCALHVVALGPGANEALLQQIAASVPNAGGSYDYAPVAGDVPINTANGSQSLNWQNYLGRIYDAKTIASAGRQRTFTAVGQPTTFNQPYTFVVDDSIDELVVATSWQTPIGGPTSNMRDPNNNLIADTFRSFSSQGTNEVWRIPDPIPGTWTLSTTALGQQYYVSVSARTQLELFLFTGTPEISPTQGVRVPIVASFVNNGQPATGANVTALVTAPNGTQRLLKLHDDGLHGDSEANDGVYGNTYRPTSMGEMLAGTPVEGSEVQSVGSYQIEAVGLLGALRREAQGSFVIEAGADEDSDGIPDRWETENGLDPTDGEDGRDDPDGDGLYSFCEFTLGTDPQNSDTDNGGERDGSEAPNCVLGTQDPLEPGDDRVGRITVLRGESEATSSGPSIHLTLGRPTAGILRSYDLYRRTYSDTGELLLDWVLIGDDLATLDYVDEAVEPGRRYQYRADPLVEFTLPTLAGAAPQETVGGALLESNLVEASSDPYAPEGSVLINDGMATTNSRFVTLSISAEDSAHNHGEGDEGHTAPPGTPVNELMMRLSNSPDFTGVPWQPFQATVANWDLGAVASESRVTVYVQFKDAAGNIGADGLGQDDDILYRSVDVNTSGAVDIVDVQSVSGAWGRTATQTGWLPALDLNGSDEIDINDIVTVAMAWE